MPVSSTGMTATRSVPRRQTAGGNRSDAFTAAIQAIRDSGEYKTINDAYFEVDIYGGSGV